MNSFKPIGLVIDSPTQNTTVSPTEYPLPGLTMPYKLALLLYVLLLLLMSLLFEPTTAVVEAEAEAEAEARGAGEEQAPVEPREAR